MVRENEEKRKNSRDNRGRTADNRDTDVDPLTDFIPYVISQGKLPRRTRIFIKLYGLYWRVKRLVRKE
ncbi:hypothetical protein [Acidianus sp. HS-5]|uniref:hypothetical protein n=1 Tax=Acidianus sp. HS-5 TaxID=2886040 RepID=UPI001F1D88A6|nr:hypothetical protein [Acidianus sp. HS-5]BDC18227.1 hypothetical protein HS5_11170 [Acidianus sp. HS-5]